MKKKLNNALLVLLISLFTCLTFASNMTDEEDFIALVNPGDPGADPGATPINDYLVPMLLLGSIMGYRMLNKKHKSII